MIQVMVNSTIRVSYGGIFVKRIVKETENLVGKQKGGIEVNIVNARTIKKINHEFRGIDEETDVLSFAWREDEKIKSDFLGQIYICYPRIVKQAKERGLPVKEEFARVFTHGFLHLLGYDHIKKSESKKMFVAQESVTKSMMKRG